MSLYGVVRRIWRTTLRSTRGVGSKREVLLRCAYDPITRNNKSYRNCVTMSRHYKNDYEDYSAATSHDVIASNNDMYNDAFKILLTTETKKLLQIMEANDRTWHSRDDCSVYTGLAGIAYMFFRYGKCNNNSTYIKKATELLEKCFSLENVSGFNSKRDITFLTGAAGPIALAAVISHSQHKEAQAKQLVSKLQSMASYVLDKSYCKYDELLYGRGGYLAALLYVNANIYPPPVEGNLIKEVASLMIDVGIAYSSRKRHKSILMYSWHDTEYLGAAHGLAGILYLLLQAREYLTQEQIDKYVKPSLYYLQGLQYPSGNFPSSMGSQSDKLVHWCHGAPGMTALFCLAHKVFKDNELLDTAVRCADVIWQRGLLTKGYSICHGVAGNAYAFLHLFQHTKDIKYLYRACKFAEWCFHYGSHQNRSPDRPFSLFEGLAGVIYFLTDMQEPHAAKFPSYDICNEK